MSKRQFTPPKLIEKAQKAYSSARALYEHHECHDFDSIVHFAYFAMFDAARAALLALRAPVKLCEIRKHDGLAEAFDKFIIQNGLVAKEMAYMLNRAHETRITADYGAVLTSREEAEKTMEHAETFLATILAEFDCADAQEYDTKTQDALSMELKQPAKLDDPDMENAIRRFLTLLPERYDIAGAILYGSRARGTHTRESDADVAILLNGTAQDRVPVILDMSDTTYDIMLETNIFISPFPIWLEEWKNPEDFSNPELLYNIQAEGIRII